MKQLSISEVHFVSGGRIRPSQWVFPAGAGAACGVLAATVTKFSQNAVGYPIAILAGTIVGVAFAAAHDYLDEYERSQSL